MAGKHKTPPEDQDPLPGFGLPQPSISNPPLQVTATSAAEGSIDDTVEEATPAVPEHIMGFIKDGGPLSHYPLFQGSSDKREVMMRYFRQFQSGGKQDLTHVTDPKRICPTFNSMYNSYKKKYFPED